MIVGLEGIIEQKEPTFVDVNVQGLVYRVFVSLNCSTAIKDNKIKLLITQIIKEDSHTLYGFVDKNEQKLFNTVIKINGVGPKVALAICSTFTPKNFATIIANKDIASLKQVPGIGAKGASRILVELSGFIIEDNQNKTISANFSEASMALESLGFKKEQISKVLTTCEATTTALLVKEALRKLQK